MPLRGPLFPEIYPAHFKDPTYYYMKYYQTHYMFFSLGIKPNYINKEILVYAFNGNQIDLSEARIYEIKNTELKQKDFDYLVG